MGAKLRTRAQRKLGDRPRTLKTRELLAEVRREAEPLLDRMLATDPRPRNRGECEGGPRPCPWVGCRYHLAVDVKEDGHLRYNFPDKDLEELRDTCALDVADRGHHSREDVGDYLNITGQRVTQIEKRLRRVIRLQVMGQDALDDDQGEDGEDDA